MSTKARRPLTLREMQKMSKADLRDICRERGLILGGRKAELISRIESHGKEQNNGDAAAASDDEDDDGDQLPTMAQTVYPYGITFVRTGHDLPLSYLTQLVAFLRDTTDSDGELKFARFFLARERGPGAMQLHGQGCAGARGLSTAATFTNFIYRNCFNWRTAGERPANVQMRCKLLNEQGMHDPSMVNMTGYCRKDEGKEHFLKWCRGFTDEELAAGLRYQLQHGGGAYKNVTELNIHNMLQKARNFQELAIESGGADVPLQHVILEMLRSGMFKPSMYLAAQGQGRGLDVNMAGAVYKLFCNPEAATPEMIQAVYFPQQDVDWNSAPQYTIKPVTTAARLQAAAEDALMRAATGAAAAADNNQG